MKLIMRESEWLTKRATTQELGEKLGKHDFLYCEK